MRRESSSLIRVVRVRAPAGSGCRSSTRIRVAETTKAPSLPGAMVPTTTGARAPKAMRVARARDGRRRLVTKKTARRPTGLAPINPSARRALHRSSACGRFAWLRRAPRQMIGGTPPGAPQSLVNAAKNVWVVRSSPSPKQQDERYAGRSERTRPPAPTGRGARRRRRPPFLRLAPARVRRAPEGSVRAVVGPPCCRAPQPSRPRVPRVS